MRRNLIGLCLIVSFLACSLPAACGEDKPAVAEGSTGQNVLWVDPVDLASRNLLFGPGGDQGQPKGPMTFVEEDRAGTNPKFEVLDHDGTKWKAKLGVEARPETVATRLLWAVGYFADQDYMLTNLQVEKMPTRLRRGQHLVGPGGKLENVRLERHIKGEDKVGEWRWKKNPFTGTREFNGLRVMMALINNWDLKDQNNAIYSEKAYPEKQFYAVSDLGATFGSTGFGWTQESSKGNLKSYRRSKFISKVTPDYVDFNVPTRPVWIRFFGLPAYVSRLHMREIGKRVPRADAKWMGGLLAKLSAEQIRDAFRSGGYSSEDVEGFAGALEKRIAELNKL